ncbi:MAG: monovalent cation/H+ antiporter subunit D family protein [Firmicutes bacterium]|nr:monovalent cation/H+ antiporter subunit D family protein [Bacillota bacterium]
MGCQVSEILSEKGVKPVEIVSNLPLYAVIIPIIGALLLIFIPEKDDEVRNPLTLITSIITATVVILIIQKVFAGNILSYKLVEIMPGLDFAFRVDPFGALFGGVASILWVFTVLYAIGYMSFGHNRRRFFIFFLLSLSVTMGIALAANLFTLYLFYELLTLATYPLVIHEGQEKDHKAGLRYIIYSFSGAGLVLFALFATFGFAGSLDFAQGGIFGEAVRTAPMALNIIFVSYILGFGVKAAIMPLHAWLPSAMVAPTPVSALLHAVAVVKSGVFGVLRVMYSVYGTQALIDLNIGLYVIILMSISIIVASIIALKQDVLKRRLAFSTISQLGYITLGAALLTQLGLTGGLLHIVNHAVLKITLFFCAGAIITMTGKERISELNGVGKRMPITMLAFTIGSIGMVGILPLNGFYSKWYMMLGGLEGHMPIIIVILMTSAVLNACYFFPIIVAAFFKKGEFTPAKGIEAPVSMLLPIAVLALTAIVFGIKLDLTIPFVQDVARYLF